MPLQPLRRLIPATLPALFLFACSAVPVQAQTASYAALLILSKQDHTLAIVDPATLQVRAKAPVGEDPHEVIASSDGRAAYVSNYGFGRFNTLTEIDLVTGKQKSVIDLGALRGPHGLAFVQGKVWFTAEAAKAVGRYDPQSGKIDWIMGTGQNRTHMIYVNPGANRVITTNVNSGTVMILDKVPAQGGPPPPGAPAVPGFPKGAILPPGGDWQPTIIPVGTRDEGFDVSPDGKEAWVANAGDGTVSIIDVAGKRVTATLQVDVPGANRLKFTLDGKRVLISQLNSGVVTVLDAATHQVTKRVPVGRGGAGILMDPSGTRAFVACSPDGYVAVIDLNTLTVTGHIDAGGNPDGLAWAVR